jgi:hypothetical protein
MVLLQERLPRDKMKSDLRKLITIRESTKLWHKPASEEKAILEKITINNFLDKLSYNSFRKVLKKEIYKRALAEIKSLEPSEDATNVKQILFYHRLGSSNKNSNKNFLNQLKNKTIASLYNFENFPNCAKMDDYEEGFRIARQYQIKEIYWKHNSESITVIENNNI